MWSPAVVESMREALHLEVLWSLSAVYPCVDRARHARGESSHTPGAVATHRVFSPCCGPRGEVCESRAVYLRDVAATIRCNGCGRSWPATEYRFYPLGVK